MSADYNEEAYENALIELFQNMGGSMFMGQMLNVTGILRFMILFLKILSGSLIQRRHLPQLTRCSSNSDTLKMLNLKRKTPFLWNTCRTALK